ncbi:hypothetical protein GQ457_02G022730 [Hibiscus cannabinus]
MPPRNKRLRTGSSSSTVGNESQPNFASLFNLSFNQTGEENQLQNFQFNKNFNIRRERRVDYTWLSSQAFAFRYLELLREWKFISFLTLEPTVYKTMVRIFYANAKFLVDTAGIKTIEIESYIMRRTIILDVPTLANHLGQEDEGVEDETAQIPFVHAPGSSVSVLDAHDRILHFLITWWFRPSGGKWSSIRGVDVFWLHCFLTGNRINLARIIFAEIVHTVNHHHTTIVKSFTYACVLSHIFRNEGIDCSLNLATPLTDPINEKSLKKSKFQLVDGEWIRDLDAQEGDDDHPAPPVDAPPAPVAPPPNDALLAYLEGKFAALDTRMSSIDSSIASLRMSFDTRFTSLESRICGIETSIAGFHHEWRTLSHGDDDDHYDDDDDGATV